MDPLGAVAEGHDYIRVYGAGRVKPTALSEHREDSNDTYGGFNRSMQQRPPVNQLAWRIPASCGDVRAPEEGLESGVDLSRSDQPGTDSARRSPAHRQTERRSPRSGHDRGSIHWNLEPANVKGKDDGMVKVLDSRLTKAFQSDASILWQRSAPANSPPPRHHRIVIDCLFVLSHARHSGKGSAICRRLERARATRSARSHARHDGHSICGRGV